MHYTDMKLSQETIDTMMKQIALDCNLGESYEIAKDVILAPSKKIKGARIMDKMDLFMKIIVFRGRAYIMADESVLGGCEDFFSEIKPEWLFEYFTLRKIDHILGEYGRSIVDTHIYYLPVSDFPMESLKGNEIWLDEKAIKEYKEKEIFKNALRYSKNQPCEMAIAIKEADKYIAMAGSGMDGKYVRQIGVDVLPDYRGLGLSVHLVRLLKQRIIESGSLPFYGTNQSHILSQNVALSSGFIPAFSEIFVAKKENGRYKETRH